MFSNLSPTAPGFFFEKEATVSIIAFEVFVVAMTVGLLFLLSKWKDKILIRYGLVMIGVFVFEFFTSAMWNNWKMGSWAYIYQDVSWILTIGWSTMILSVVILVDKFLSKLIHWKRFLIYLLSLVFLVIIFESIVISLGIRSYAPEVIQAMSGIKIFNTPLEALYYVPVFTALIIGFYKFWSLTIKKEAIPPTKKRNWIRDFIIAFLGVFFFEVMIEPMAVNNNLPSWSYIYNDISFLLTLGWVFVIWISVSVIDKIVPDFSIFERFVLYITLATIIALPTESFLMSKGIRLYSESVANNFTGFYLPFTKLPVEIAFGVFFYLLIMLSFIKYWIFTFNHDREK